jgi:tetratricopeptide (TPR) repeat protein
MIVRDEEPRLGDCLRSLQGVVDEIVIVDTGSVDDSVALARSLGARVAQMPWSGSFGVARNAALDLARGRWILYIDADERLLTTGRDAVEHLLGAADVVAFRVLLRPFVGSTPYREYRLWRSDPRIRFEGVVHEKVAPSIRAVARADGRAIRPCGLELQHVGYEGDQSHKHARNLPLLRAQLANEPDNVFNLWHLATILRAVGEDAQAEDALARAVEVARGGVHGQYGAQAFAELAVLRRERGGHVDDLVAEGRRRYPRNLRLVWIEARLEMDAGRHERALPLLDRLLAVDLRAAVEEGTAYDERLFGSFAHESRGECLFRLGRYREAADAFAAAERREPDRMEHRLRRQLAEARAV